MSISRRSFLRGAAAAGIGVLGSQFTSFERLARAQATPEHFFLFIELKGGVAWQYATDGRDLATLPMGDENVVRKVELLPEGKTAPLSADEQDRVLGGNGAMDPHGNVIILPFIDTPEASYKKGVTNTGATWRLGLSGHALEKHVNDIAVVRGVRGLHDFHGGANDEAWSGIFNDRPDQTRKHMAGTVAAHLAKERGALLLDNIVFEGATFPGAPGDDFLNPMRIDVRSLGMLAATQDAKGSVDQRFANARRLADSIGNAKALGTQHKQAFAAYLSSLEKGPIVQQRLAALAERLGTSDASLDLDRQVDTAITLFEGGLSRVATLCLGASNGMNDVDGFGLFDAHYGLVHKTTDGDSRQRTYGHHLNVMQAMDSLARLIERLKTTQHKGKSLFEQTTVVVTSEFSRPSNASGNEDEEGRFGAGHYNHNNNVILFGKGIKGGGWIGDNDPVTQYAHLVKMNTLEQPDPRKVEYVVPSFFTLDEGSNVRNVPDTKVFEGQPVEDGIDFVAGAERPIMSKDILRTVYEAAGLGSKFKESYGGSWFKDARKLGPVVA